MTASLAAPRLSMDLPAGFAGMPLTADAAANTAKLGELAARLASASGQPLQAVRENLITMISYFSGTEVRMFGKFAVGEPAAPASLLLAVGALTGRSTVDRPALAKALVETYRHRHPGADARVVELGSGPALAALVSGEMRIPPEVTGRAHDVVREVFRMEFQIPAGAWLVDLSITADTPDGWPEIATAAYGIADSLRVLKEEQHA